MTDFRFGPVDLFLIGYEGDRPDPGVTASILELASTGLIRLLDVLVITKAEDGTVAVSEVEEVASAFGFDAVEILAVGIAGDEDVAELSQQIPAGSSAVLVALELTFARNLAQRFAESGATVLSYDRIPAPVVNAVADLADEIEQFEAGSAGELAAAAAVADEADRI